MLKEAVSPILALWLKKLSALALENFPLMLEIISHLLLVQLGVANLVHVT